MAVSSNGAVGPAPLISVVIPVRNEAGQIEACIRGLLEQTVAIHEIIVLDSGSTDGTLEILARFPEVRVIPIEPAEFNHGETRNVGVRAARGDLVLLTVGDAHPADRFCVERLLAGFSDDRVAGVCGTQVVPHHRDKNPLQWFRPIDEPNAARFEFESADEFDRQAPDAKRRACGWDNVCALYRRAVLLDIPFRRTTYGEDGRWAKDALRAGHALVYEPGARVHHYHRETAEYAFRLAVTTMYFRYREFGYLYDAPRLVRPVTYDALRLLFRVPDLRWSERWTWVVYNARLHGARWRATRTFRRAAARGRDTLDGMHQRYCGTPPIPQKAPPGVVALDAKS